MKRINNIASINDKKNSLKLIIICLIAILFILIILSPLLTIKSIAVEGIQKYTTAEILDKINLNSNMNLLSFNYFTAKKTLKSDPYINNASIKFSAFPIKVSINIEERRVRGYVPYMGAYLYIDEYGTVLQSETYFKEKLPIVIGLDFDQFKIGNQLKVKNEASFEVVLKMQQMMLKYDLASDVVKVDVSDPIDVRIYIRDIEVSIGDMADCDEKIRTMIEIIKTIPEEDRGYLEIKDIKIPPVFKYLT